MLSDRYDLFLSYSHRRDRDFAARLQSALEGVGRPFWKLRSMRAFRDDAALAVTPELWPDIQRALDRSGFFLLLASPESAAPREGGGPGWPTREALHFLRRKGMRRRFGIVLTAGLLEETDGIRARGHKDESLSPELKEELRRQRLEPLMLDLRPFHRSSRLRDRFDTGFQGHIAAIAARVLNQPKDALYGAHIRRQRFAIAGLSVLLLLLAVASLAALWQSEKARAREAEARNAARAAVEALSEQVVELGWLALSGEARFRDPARAIAYAFEAARLGTSGRPAELLDDALLYSRAWARLMPALEGYPSRDVRIIPPEDEDVVNGDAMAVTPDFRTLLSHVMHLGGVKGGGPRSPRAIVVRDVATGAQLWMQWLEKGERLRVPSQGPTHLVVLENEERVRVLELGRTARPPVLDVQGVSGFTCTEGNWPCYGLEGEGAVVAFPDPAHRAPLSGRAERLWVRPTGGALVLVQGADFTWAPTTGAVPAFPLGPVASDVYGEPALGWGPSPGLLLKVHELKGALHLSAVDAERRVVTGLLDLNRAVERKGELKLGALSASRDGTVLSLVLWSEDGMVAVVLFVELAWDASGVTVKRKGLRDLRNVSGPLMPLLSPDGRTLALVRQEIAPFDMRGPGWLDLLDVQRSFESLYEDAHDRVISTQGRTIAQLVFGSGTEPLELLVREDDGTIEVFRPPEGHVHWASEAPVRPRASSWPEKRGRRHRLLGYPPEDLRLVDLVEGHEQPIRCCRTGAIHGALVSDDGRDLTIVSQRELVWMRDGNTEAKHALGAAENPLQVGLRHILTRQEDTLLLYRAPGLVPRARLPLAGGAPSWVYVDDARPGETWVYALTQGSVLSAWKLSGASGGLQTFPPLQLPEEVRAIDIVGADGFVVAENESGRTPETLLTFLDVQRNARLAHLAPPPGGWPDTVFIEAAGMGPAGTRYVVLKVSCDDGAFECQRVAEWDAEGSTPRWYPLGSRGDVVDLHRLEGEELALLTLQTQDAFTLVRLGDGRVLDRLEFRLASRLFPPPVGKGSEGSWVFLSPETWRHHAQRYLMGGTDRADALTHVDVSADVRQRLDAMAPVKPFLESLLRTAP